MWRVSKSHCKSTCHGSTCGNHLGKTAICYREKSRVCWGSQDHHKIQWLAQRTHETQHIIVLVTMIRASQAALVEKNLPADEGDARDMGSIPGSGKIPCSRKWQPTPVFLPGKSHGQRSLAGYSLWAAEPDMTEHMHTRTWLCLITASWFKAKWAKGKGTQAKVKKKKNRCGILRPRTFSQWVTPDALDSLQPWGMRCYLLGKLIRDSKT